MANKNYQRGSAFERYVKKKYEDCGYFCVKSAGSKGKADVVALGYQEVILIQCKLKGAISKEEKQQFTELVDSLECTGIIAYGGTGKNYQEEVIIGVSELQESWGPEESFEGYRADEDFDGPYGYEPSEQYLRSHQDST